MALLERRYRTTDRYDKEQTLSLASLVWGVDSVKSTVSVLEEGDFSEEGGGFDWRGYFSVGGYQFLWRSAFRSRGGDLVHLE